MLVSRKPDSEQNHWPMSKYDSLYHYPASNPRMSHHYDTPLSTQPDWQGQQYSFHAARENHPYGQSSYNSNNNNSNDPTSSSSIGIHAQPRSATESGGMDIDPKSEGSIPSPSVSQRRGDSVLGIHSQRQLSPMSVQGENQGELYAKKAGESTNKESFHAAGPTSNSNAMSSSITTSGHNMERPASQTRDDSTCKQEDDDEVIDDDEVDETDGTQEMTPAERTAARRKMKRFR